MATSNQGGSLAGTSALVTGGESALGLACARRLAADGAVVTICGTA
jgi:NAD(P)-dependent dehydrogenase (short-subunit alcohol dehydrogenase family)